MQSTTKKLLIGITGQIASGKTTAALFFKDAGYPVITADELSRQVTKKGMPALDTISSQMGNKYLNYEGNLDRALLRKKVFSSSEALKQLNAILHPFMKQEANKQKERFFQKSDVVFFDCAILLQVDLIDGIDKIIVVVADEDVLINRVMQRDNISREDTRKILNNQLPVVTLKSKADFIINNSHDIKQLKSQLEPILEDLKKATGQ